jgi:hypothetical protein
MDQVISSFNIAKCYIDDIVVFNLTSKGHKHHLHNAFEKFNNHNLKLHLGKC